MWNQQGVRRPFPYSEEIPVPVYKYLCTISKRQKSKISATENSQCSIHSSALSETGDKAPQVFTQKDLNDLIRILGLLKEKLSIVNISSIRPYLTCYSLKRK